MIIVIISHGFLSLYDEPTKEDRQLTNLKYF